jgi:hypothetical protein
MRIVQVDEAVPKILTDMLNKVVAVEDDELNTRRNI